MSDETFAGEPLDPYALKDEITRLRAELAAEREQKFRHMDNSTKLCNELIAIRAENEKLREALIRIDGMATTICMKDDAGYGIRAESVMPIYETARAALEGVMEPASPWRDIKSAPRDKEILVFGKKDDGTDYQEVCKYYDAANCWPIVLMHGYLAPTHWMPLPEPPND